MLSELTLATKELFLVLSERNVKLKLSHVRSDQNKADGTSRYLSPLDSKLSPKAWIVVEEHFGGNSGHTFDLMALDSNVQLDCSGHPLPHFTPFASPHTSGINLFCQDLQSDDVLFLNPYVFPPFGLIGTVLQFLVRFRRAFTIVVPEAHPHRYWWPGLVARCSAMVLLGVQGDKSVILGPSKTGFKPLACPYDTWACRVSKF